MGKSSETVNVPSAHAFTQNIFGVLIASIKAWFNDGQSYDTVSFFFIRALALRDCGDT